MPEVVGIYPLNMKSGLDNFRASAIQRIVKLLKAKRREVVVYVPELNEKEVFHSKVFTDLENFKKDADVIVNNRMCAQLENVAAKVYTQDLFGSD